MSPQMPVETGQLTSSKQAPVTRHWPPAPAGARRLARGIGETPARAAFVIMIALLAGCTSSATTGPSATPTQSAAAAASTPPAARTFTSRHYGYTEALPAGWSSAVQATQQWDGTGSPGDQDSVVDLFQGPGGIEAWALACRPAAIPAVVAAAAASVIKNLCMGSSLRVVHHRGLRSARVRLFSVRALRRRRTAAGGTRRSGIRRCPAR